MGKNQSKSGNVRVMGKLRRARAELGVLTKKYEKARIKK